MKTKMTLLLESPDQQSLSDGIISLSSEQKAHDIGNVLNLISFFRRSFKQ